eukprot:m.222943 g.222943  ORF g.222943 m.222943 type:complete len:743 (-) comp54185_c0_seq10:368-2596(-)
MNSFKREFSLSVRPREVYQDGARFGTDQQDFGALSDLNLQYFIGHDVWEPSLRAVLRVDGAGTVNGFLFDESPKAFEIYVDDRDGNNYIKRVDGDSLRASAADFSSDVRHPPSSPTDSRRRAGPISPDHKFCDIYVDCDASYFNQFGAGSTHAEKVSSTATRILNLFSLVAAIYDGNFDTFTVALAGITVHTTLELGRPGDDIGVTLDTYGNLLVDQNTRTPSDVRNGGPRGDQVCLNHLVTFRDFNLVLGVAYVHALCRTQPQRSLFVQGYQLFNIGVTTAILDPASNSRVMAHELGHNLGASHDNDFADAACLPDADPFLMSESINFGSNAATFSSCSRASVQSAVATRGSCFKTAQAPISTRNPSVTTSTATTAPPATGGGWLLAGFGQSCASACPDHACAVVSQNRLTSASILASVLDILPGAPTCASFAEASSPRLSFSSSMTTADVCSFTKSFTTCQTTSPPLTRQLCCCSSVACPIPALDFTTSTIATPVPTTNPAAQGWAIGAVGQSCSQVCGTTFCNTDSQNAITTRTAFEFVSNLIGGTPVCTDYLESTFAEDPSWYSSGICYLSGRLSTCGSSESSTRRMCCCNPTGCPTSAPSSTTTQTPRTTKTTTFKTTKTTTPKTTTTTTRISGWFLGPPGSSCGVVCAGKQACNAASMDAVNTAARLQYVLSTPNIVGKLTCTSYVARTKAFAPSGFSDGKCYYKSTVGTACQGRHESAPRLCCCSDTACPVEHAE